METISWIAEIYASAAGMLAIIWILLALYEKKPRTKTWEIVAWFLISFSLAHFQVMSNTVQSVMSVVANIVFAWLLLKGKRLEMVLVVIGANIFMILVSMIGTRIAVAMSGEGITQIVMQGSQASARVIKIVINNSLYLLTAYLISKIYTMKIKLKREEYLIISICYALLFGISVLSTAIMGSVPLEEKWQMAFLIVDILMLSANAAVLWLIACINKQNNYEMENVVLKLQLTQQEKEIKQREKSNLEIRMLRHDMKRYFVTYQQLLRDGQYELVERDIEKVLGEKLETEWCQYTENQIINSILNEKVSRCKEKNIGYRIRVKEVPKEESMELGIMLSNLMDNAIEAEEKESKENRFIEVEVKVVEQMLHIIVKNYITKSVLEKNPNMYTSKKDRYKHGIGLKGVKEYVYQRDGQIEIYEADEKFIVHICIGM